MPYNTRISWETLRSVDSSTFSGSYVAVGGPLANPSYKLKLVNNSTADVTVSIDGATDIDVAPAGSFWLYDESTTIAQQAIPKGTQIYVKGTSGAGVVYLVSQYLENL